MSEFSDSMNSVLGSAQYIQDQYAQGEARKKRNGLAQLASQYYSGGQKADPAFLGQVAALDPQMVGAFQKDQYGQQDRQREQLGRMAALLVKAPPQMRPQIWEAQVKPGLVAMGLPAEGPYSAEYDQMAQELAQAFGGGSGVPAGVQEFKYMSQGMDAPDQARARRIALGLDPRAASGGMKFDENLGADGRLRPQRMNPQNGMVEVLGDYGWEPLGGQSAPPTPPPVSAMQLAADLQRFGGKITSGYRTPQHNRDVGGVNNSFHISGQALDVVMPTPQLKANAKKYMESLGYQVIDEGDHLHAEPRPQSAEGNRYASRPPEQQAGLTTASQEQAKIDAQVGNTGRVAQSEAEIAAAKAGAETAAKAAAERDSAIAQRTQNAGTALDLLNEAERILPSSTGSGLGAARDSAAAYFGESTSGAQGAARLKTLSGQLILMQPRMEGPQSDADRKLYAQMAGDLGNETLPVATRMAALKGMKKLQAKYAGQQAPAGKFAGFKVLD